LAILAGNLYVPFGGHFGDCGQYRGFVVGISLSDPRTIKSWATRARGGGIWAPGGISTDGTSLFVATGNTFGARTWSDGEAVIRLAPDFIDCINPADGELVANFDGRAVTYGFGELDMLVPAYAATIHKSQGSEYPAVVIPIMTQHYAMLRRNLLYTGVTRGKKLVVLVGQKKAVAIAVRNVSGRRRWSKLQEWLRPNPCLSRQIDVAS
jgi:hypothetical protein